MVHSVSGSFGFGNDISIFIRYGNGCDDFFRGDKPEDCIQKIRVQNNDDASEKSAQRIIVIGRDNGLGVDCVRGMRFIAPVYHVKSLKGGGFLLKAGRNGVKRRVVRKRVIGKKGRTVTAAINDDGKITLQDFRPGEVLSQRFTLAQSSSDSGTDQLVGVLDGF